MSQKKTCHQTFIYILYLHQISTDFKNSFTDVLCGKFAVTQLLNIPPHLYCVATLPLKYKFSKIAIITINTYVKTYPMKQFSTNLLSKVNYIQFLPCDAVCTVSVIVILSVRPSVCLSVCLSHSWTVSTWFDLRS